MMVRHQLYVGVMLGVVLVLHTQAIQAQPKNAPLKAGVSYQSEPPADGKDLMINGSFETPSKTEQGPAFWQQPDNLVWHWIEGGEDPGGKIIRIDTDVNQRQAYAWWVDRYMHGKPLVGVPEKQITKPPKYATIAGLDGGFYISDFIPVEEGGAYRVFVDAKGPASKVFIFGYVEKLPMHFGDEQPAVQQAFREARGESDVTDSGRAKKYRLRYRYRTWFQVGGSDQWTTYTHKEPRHPNDREITEDVRWIRIMLYPYWPPGVYEYDNVRVYQVDPSETRNRREGDAADVEEGRIIK